MAVDQAIAAFEAYDVDAFYIHVEKAAAYIDQVSNEKMKETLIELLGEVGVVPADENVGWWVNEDNTVTSESATKGSKVTIGLPNLSTTEDETDVILLEVDVVDGQFSVTMEVLVPGIYDVTVWDENGEVLYFTEDAIEVEKVKENEYVDWLVDGDNKVVIYGEANGSKVKVGLPNLATTEDETDMIMLEADVEYGQFSVTTEAFVPGTYDVTVWDENGEVLYFIEEAVEVEAL